MICNLFLRLVLDVQLDKCQNSYEGQRRNEATKLVATLRKLGYEHDNCGSKEIFSNDPSHDISIVALGCVPSVIIGKIPENAYGVAGLISGCVSSPNSHRIAPDKNIEIATNQKAASTDPLKCAAIPSPNAPMP